MKKSILYLVLLGTVFFSCTKQIPAPVNYSVSDQYGNALQYVYLGTNDSTTLPVLVKFLTGSIYDSVKLVLGGLPAGVTALPDSITALPTYTANFQLKDNGVAPGTYPVSITAYTITGKQVFNFDLVVTTSDCAAPFSGTLSGSNACTSKNYTYSSTATVSGGTLSINNFGGYGVNTNADVVFDCNNNTLTMASQNIGNGVTVQGSGSFTNNTITIHYTAANIPSGGNDECTVTYTK